MTDEIPNAVTDLHATPPHEPVEPAAPPLAETLVQREPLAKPVDRSGTLLAAVVVLALVVLVGGYLLWRNGSGSADEVAQLQNQLTASQAQLGTLQARLEKVEARPLPTPPPPAPDLRPLEQRLTTLEQKPPPTAQLDSAGQAQIAAVSSRIDGVAARQNQLGTTEQADVIKLAAAQQADTAKLNDQIATLTSQMAAVTKAGSAIATLADRQSRTARLQMANVALQSGKPLGEIPGAPAALAQFATKPPPTEASLRLSFEAAASAAHEAGQPAKEDTPFLARMWDRAQSGVTVRQGDRVLVGDAVAGVLEKSRHLLEAGDLPGAVAALDGLTGPAAAAMAPWRSQAQSLLDARSALITAANG